MDHGTPTDHDADQASFDPAARYKTRLGLILVLVYGFIYAGFVAINTFAPTAMEVIVLFGVNLAVTYGFGLIVVAIVMGLFYNLLSTRKERELATDEGSAE